MSATEIMTQPMSGPWQWSGSDLNGINEKGELDSVIFSTVEYDDGHYSELHCEPADRALIAAAPDLLHACEWILTDLVFAAPETFVERAYRWADVAKAAIEKARAGA